MNLYTAERIRDIACGDAIVAIVEKTTPGYDWVHRELMFNGQRLAGEICLGATPSIPEELTTLVTTNGGFTASEARACGVDIDALIRNITTELEASLNVRLVQRKDIDEYTMLILSYPQPHCLDAFVVDRAVPIRKK